jgi:predicted RNA-binding Zn-ribbon protein involved in translation (DUF1610 family)
MAQRTLPCGWCGLEIVVEEGLQSAACPSCGTWHHATTCMACGEPYVAVGVGVQTCPFCAARYRLSDARTRTFSEIELPLADARSTTPPPPPPAPFSTESVPEPWNAFAGSLAFALWAGALVALVVGVWGTIASVAAADRAHARGWVPVEIIVGLSLTALGASVLAALAYLLERAEDHTRSLKRIEAALAASHVDAEPPL